MNEVRLYGRIAKELPSIEELTNRPLLLILAVDKFVAGEKDVDFIPIKVWGKIAKNICEYKSKGDELIVFARLGVGKYEKDGKKMHILEVTANSVEFIGSKKKDVTQKQIDDANATSSEYYEDNISKISTVQTSNNSHTKLEDNSCELKEESSSTNNNNSDFNFSSKEDEDFFNSIMSNFDSPFGSK